MIANDVVALLESSETFGEITAIMPGFINIKVSDAFLASYVNEMNQDEIEITIEINPGTTTKEKLECYKKAMKKYIKSFFIDCL